MFKTKLWGTWSACVLCGYLATSVGCVARNHTEAGAMVGSGVGGVMGALIGGQSGHAAGGAVVGALAGAAVGGLAGNAEDARDERDAAIAQAQYNQHVAAQQAVTNVDLMTMAQAGLSDQVIVNAVQTRGGNFDLSPSAIIELKNRGVSDSVILSIQNQNTVRPVATTYAYPTTTIVSPTPVYIAPRPTIGVGVVVGPRPYYGYRGYGPYHRHRHHW